MIQHHDVTTPAARPFVPPMLGAGRVVTPIALLLLVGSSLLPWYHASAGPFSVSLSGWHQIGIAAWVLVSIALVVAVVAAVLRTPSPMDLVAAVASALAVLLVWAFVIVRLIDGSLGAGLYVGGVLSVVAAAGSAMLLAGYLQSPREVRVAPAAYPGAVAAAPVPGWYPDPGGSGRHRWWDGMRWTEHVG